VTLRTLPPIADREFMGATVPRILIVEDQYFVAIDNELSLRDGGFEVVGLATTAKEAVEFAERERPDLILMDIRLASRADGVEAAIAIHERLGVRCIFTSGHADAQVREQAKRAHPLGWLDKPYTSAALLEAVQGALAKLRLAAKAPIGLSKELHTISP
jgi:two-component system, response regulator PdtaR